MKKIAWLQTTWREPRPFKTKAAALREVQEIVEKADAAGWEIVHGSAARGRYIFERAGKTRATIVDVVDEDGWCEIAKGVRMRCREEFRGVTA